MSKQLNLTVEVRQAPKEDPSIKLVRCIDIPRNNWARLWKGELGKIETNDDYFSDCWERVYLDLKDYSGDVVYSTDPSLKIDAPSDSIIDYIIAFLRDNHEIPVLGPRLREFFKKL